jgi:hypothetical protein
MKLLKNITSFFLKPFAISAVSDKPLNYIDPNITADDIEIIQSYGRENKYHIVLNFIAYGQKVRMAFHAYKASEMRAEEYHGLEEANKKINEILEIVKNKDFSITATQLKKEFPNIDDISELTDKQRYELENVITELKVKGKDYKVSVLARTWMNT